MRPLFLRLFVAALVATPPVFAALPEAVASVPLLISSQPTDPGASSTNRVAGSALLTVVTVGAAPVSISNFGTFGQLPTVGNLKWVIFQGSAGTTGLTPAFSTAATPTGALSDGMQWYDSPTFSFTLVANSTYLMGVISDQAFNYSYDFPGETVVSNGLTLVSGENGNASDFTAPTTTGSGGVLPALRIFGPVSAAPEPGTLALLGMAVLPLGALGLRKRRRK